MVWSDGMRRGRQIFALSLCVGLSCPSGTTYAVPLVWDKRGAFETCLETSFDAWLKQQAELVVN
jgi:hypothetical protein